MKMPSPDVGRDVGPQSAQPEQNLSTTFPFNGTSIVATWGVRS
ncbi:hypothetical protein ACVWXB_001524 [Streptomyces sp. TE12347]